MLVRSTGALLCGLLVSAGDAAAQQVRGRVVDEAQRAPLADAAVTVMTADSASVASTTTGADGFFFVDLDEPGSYLVRVAHPGYGPVVREVELGAELRTVPAFVLEDRVIPLEGVDVEVERGAVGERNSVAGRRASILAGGRLAELEENGVSFVSAVRNLTAGVRVRNVMVGERSLPCIESGRGPSSMGGSGGGACRMVSIIIDGVDVGTSGLPPDDAVLYLRSLDAGVRQWESIEYLSPVEAGSRYGLEAGTRGALVLWSRGRGPHRSSARESGELDQPVPALR